MVCRSKLPSVLDKARSLQSSRALEAVDFVAVMGIIVIRSATLFLDHRLLRLLISHYLERSVIAAELQY